MHSVHAGWFPSTSTDPQTAGTFCPESKALAYEFYHSLVHLTDNTGLKRQKDHYESFMCMVHEWRHLVMWKCSGQGHDSSGVMGTSEGQCVVLCPACPQPGKNLPDNWQDTPKTKSWLYSLFLAINANFCLKRCAVSSDETDLSLSQGWAYFVEKSLYKSHILDRAGETQEKSTCSSHNAVNMADTKLSQGLAAMRVGMVDCTQHNMKCPNGMVRFFILKFHLPAHVFKCQTIFSFNFTRFFNINPVASSMKAMGPGCCRDTLDDHFEDWNWKKVVGLGKLFNLGSSLLSKMKEATAEKGEHRVAFKEFDSVITPENRTSWKAEMEAWEKNPNDTTVSNPLQPKGLTITQAGARLSLARLEAEELECGVNLSLHPDVSPSVLIGLGMDLKQKQRHFKAMVDSIGIHATDRQKLMILRTRMSLCRKLEAWRQTQYLYVPLVRTLVVTSTTSNSENTEHMKLWLPSSLNSKACQGANTHAQNALARIHDRQAACIKHYRIAWGAPKSLAPMLNKDLLDDDVKPLVDPFGTRGEGRQRLTWIWMMDGMDSHVDGGDADGVHVEWCKSHARALHWAEEVELLQEEMHCVLQFLEWQADWWTARHDTATHNEAARQANICRCMAGHFCYL
ncbi:hypothetical protein EV702DRAFT_1177489 [Suillus placidus]|uniref:CxC2-like cysteine cluster KDZ transposase-associated domain-containing protein n=1 Tax=Suillus placidus TaxID=48579 RepID=A0A9P7D6E9_9AGAM|nr:hypothetical protein EV702DRAFT_1177489 [Suillus placidus]